MALGPSRKATRQGNFRCFKAHILIGFVNRQLVLSSINSKLLPDCTKLLPRNILQLSVGFSVLSDPTVLPIRSATIMCGL